jgi:O-antigen/teichoic acid export membrane protein
VGTAVAGHRARARRARAVVRREPFDVSTPEGRSNERYRRIALNTLSRVAARVVGAAVSLVSVPITLAYLGKAEYGLWAAIGSFTTWVALFDFGLVNGLVNAVSEAHGRDDRDAARSYVSTALAVLVALALVMAATFAVALPLVPWARLFSADAAVSERVVRWGVVAAVVPFLASLPLSIVRQVYAGYQKSYVVDLFSATASLLSVAAMIHAVRADAGLPVLIAIAASAGGLGAAASFAFMTRVDLPWVAPRWGAASRTAARRLLATSTPLFLFQLGALVVNESQILILAHRSGLATVADYSIVMRLYVLVVSFIALGTGAFVPSFREAFERGEHDWLRRGFRRMLALRMTAALAVAAVLLVVGNALLEVWLRSGAVRFPPATWGALGVLLAVATWGSAYSELLAILDRIWVQVGLVLVNGACTAGLTYALAPRFGVLGALIAAALVPLALISWVLPLVARPVLAPAPARP